MRGFTWKLGTLMAVDAEYILKGEKRILRADLAPSLLI